MIGSIDRVCLTHIRIPLKEPFRISGGEVAEKDAILVQLTTSDGATGLGESSPMAASFGYSTDHPDGCWNDLVDRLVPAILTRSFADEEAVASFAAEFPGCSRFAVAGVETALWDLLGQARKMSIAEMLGADLEIIARGVDSGLAVGLYPTVVDLLRTIEIHLVEGYKRVKIKIAPGRDVELVKAVRLHFGDELELMVDANAAYTREDIDMFRELDRYDLLMFEQPMAARDLDGLAALQAAVSTPVCIDESADDLERGAIAIDRRACEIVNLKIQRVGGFGPAKAMHDYCLSRGVACWVGTMPELGIGQAQGIHLSTLPNCKYPTDVEPSARWFVADYVIPAIEMVSPGILSVPMRPGLGYLIDPAKVRRYEVRRQEFVAATTA